MRSLRKKIAIPLLIATTVAISVSLVASETHKKPAAAQMESRRALHALNRLTFGPRPGDVERVEQMGVDKWIELQLHPEKIDDSALEARLAPYRSLRMDTATMLRDFPPPQVIKAVANGRMQMPSDPKLRAIYDSQLARYRDRQERKEDAAADQPANAAEKPGETDGAMMTDSARQRNREARVVSVTEADKLLGMTPDRRWAEIMKMSPEERVQLARSLRPEQRQQVLDEFTPEQRETILAMANPGTVVGSELMEGKLLRAAYSERQLQEVMTDFWFNHFNIFLGKGADHYLVTSYERDVIRPHALGKFHDLLEATAKSPAMLFYLDNWLSVGPDSDFAKFGPGRDRPMRRRGALGGGFGRPRPLGFPPPPRARRWPNPDQQTNAKRSGLNENYARELMELHTLSVNGGYSQQDVTEVAKVFTGWTIAQPFKGGEFKFNERMHEPGNKYVLGVTIHDGGQKEGEKVLEMLARSPKTAHFISYKLAQRFVSDNPPDSLVNRMTDTYLKKDGDIREVLRTMIRSPEFWAPEAYRAKVKTPLEFVASAVRATDADVTNPMPLVQAMNQMGMPLYGCQPPTGYKMTSEAWVNSSALTSRLNFALMLGTGRMRGISVDPKKILGDAPIADPDQDLVALEAALLGGDVSKQTHEVIEKRLDSSLVTGRKLDDPPRPANVGVIAGLLLGSPEFQRR